MTSGLSQFVVPHLKKKAEDMMWENSALFYTHFMCEASDLNAPCGTRTHNHLKRNLKCLVHPPKKNRKEKNRNKSRK